MLGGVSAAPRETVLSLTNWLCSSRWPLLELELHACGVTGKALGIVCEALMRHRERRQIPPRAPSCCAGCHARTLASSNAIMNGL